MLREPLLLLSRSGRVKELVTSLPVTERIVDRFVSGESLPEAVDVVGGLVADGLRATLDHLGEDTSSRDQAETTVSAYQDLLRALVERGLAGSAEVSVKLSAIGQALPDGGERVALEHARTICRAARNAGTTVTLDMEDHTTTDSTLRVLRELRKDFPETGVALQAYLRRTESDCRDLAGEGSRVRLCKGAYQEPAEVAFRSRLDVDLSYVRCLQVLMQGEGYPMVATHDPALIARTEELVAEHDRLPASYEFQMLYGIRVPEQHRIAASGRTMRVYVPYGDDWYGYFMRRLAERPANVAFFLRSFVSR